MLYCQKYICASPRVINFQNTKFEHFHLVDSKIFSALLRTTHILHTIQSAHILHTIVSARAIHQHVFT